MNDTPITDAREFEILSDLQSGTRRVVDAEVCRKLERETNRLRELLDNAKSAIQWAAENLKQQRLENNRSQTHPTKLDKTL